MSKTPAPSELCKASGISAPYATQILKGDRNPSRPLAILLFRKLGWRHSVIEGLAEDELAMLERIEPWRPAA